MDVGVFVLVKTKTGLPMKGRPGNTGNKKKGRRKDYPSAALGNIMEEDYFSSSIRPGSLAKTSLALSLVTTTGGSS